MRTEHTPGPWIFERSTRTIRAVPSNYWLASMDSWDGAVDHEANARLIAAAPDLLAALEDLIIAAEETGYVGLALCRARAAITKAKGE